MMMVLAKRKRQRELMKLVESSCPGAFIFVEELKQFRGGFWAKRI
jgi:uncharacterized protein YebE (UPF0316 family)